MKPLNSYQFFLKHAGYSYDPATQSPMQGRVQSARRLAAAERKARDMGISFKWEIDTECTVAEFAMVDEDYALWYCAAFWPLSNSAPEHCPRTCAANLGGIDFGRDGEPWGNPYRRVVEAELALEALAQLEVKL